MSQFSNPWLEPSSARGVPVQASPFEPLRIYEKPDVLVSSALEGELTPSLLRRIFNPNETLSPKERDTIVSKMKERVGGGTFGSVLVDLATNPFVWFTFLTSPVGGSTLGRGAPGLFSAAKKFGAFVVEQAPWLQTLGGLTGLQMFNNTAITPAINAISKGIADLDTEMATVVGPAIRKVLQKTGLKSLNLEELTDPQHKQLAQTVNDGIAAKLGGMDVKWTERGWKLEKKTFALKQTKVVHERKVDGRSLDGFLKQTGADELVKAYRKAQDQRWVRVFGDEVAYARAGVMQVDEQKVVRLWRGVAKNPVTSGKASLNKGTGAEIVGRLFGPEAATALRKGTVSQQQFLNVVRTVGGERPDYYLPRNILAGEFGQEARNRLLAQRQAVRVVSTGAVIPRATSSALFDPDDLERVGKAFGATPSLVRQIAETRKAVANAGLTGKEVRLFKVDGLESMTRYFKGTGESHALYVQLADQHGGIRVARKDFNPHADPLQVAAVATRHDKWKKRGLWGGESVADVLQEQHAFIKSAHTRRELTDVILPRILERPKFHETGAMAAIMQGKRGLAAFLETKAGQAIKGSGAWGAKLHGTMERFADADVTFPRSRSYSAAVAKYLYSTHMGVNLPSVVLNLTQPFILAAGQLGVGSTLKGYREAFKEISGYLGERAGQGWKLLDDADRLEMVKRHFRHANMDGEDFLDIATRDVFDDIDRMAAARFKDFSRLGMTKGQWLTDAPLWLFQKAEWLNRSVTAHAIEDVWRRSGRKVEVGTDDYFRMREDIRRGVSEFQFGSRILNTPTAFLREGVLNNPLARQFLSFPLRTLTHILHVGPRMGGREGLWKAGGFDMMRGMGISAAVYEVAKGAFGADLSGGLYAAAATDLFGGERFVEDGGDWIPLPPIVDIPRDMVVGLAAADMDVMGRTLARTVPGGVALRRLFGVSPKLPLPAEIGRLMQGTYADWENPGPDGGVMLFKGDGTSLEYRNASELVLRGLGADLGKFQQPSELVGYLVKQRDRIVESRRQALSALLGNDMRRVAAVQAEFLKEHGFPLTISQEQVRTAIKNRQTPRVERVLDRLPPEARPVYQAMVAGTRPGLTGLSKEALERGATARQRRELSGFQGGVQLDAQTVEKLKQIAAAQEQMSRGGQSFTPFGSYAGP